VDFVGLNLTRASHDAVMKYPWARDPAAPEKNRKWGYYSSERDVFEWARLRTGGDERKCVEAELMDWADDIAYAVHDMEDFYRAGMIPLNRLRADDAREEFVSEVFSEWKKAGATPPLSESDAADRLKVLSFTPINRPYAGTREQRAAIRTLTSGLVGRYVRGVGLHVPADKAERYVLIDPELLAEVLILKELTWHYAIRNPALAAQQYGQREVVRELFETFHRAAKAKPDNKESGWVRRVLPRGFADALSELEAAGQVGPEVLVRTAADAVASLTEQQALDLHRRLTGHDPKSVLDPIVR
jgi:dGTPase